MALRGSFLLGFALCASSLAAQRTETGKLRWGGLDRTFTVRVPPRADSESAKPLVIVLHGRGGSGLNVMQRAGFTAQADREGYLLIAPDGTGNPRAWETGFVPGAAIDDVGFVGALIDTALARYRVDRARVYVAGYSNGGALAHRVASDLSSRLAGVAVVAGIIGGRLANGSVARIDPPRAPVPILIVHGDADDVVPYDTTSLPSHRGRPLPARDAALLWARANECGTLMPRRDSLAAGRVVRDTWDSRCRAPVVFLTLRGGDHGWPRTDRGSAIDATDVIWEFFARHRR
jgi:polyhydroxybutyrate depolymerase